MIGWVESPNQPPQLQPRPRIRIRSRLTFTILHLSHEGYMHFSLAKIWYQNDPNTNLNRLNSNLFHLKQWNNFSNFKCCTKNQNGWKEKERENKNNNGCCHLCSAVLKSKEKIWSSVKEKSNLPRNWKTTKRGKGELEVPNWRTTNVIITGLLL